MEQPQDQAQVTFPLDPACFHPRIRDLVSVLRGSSFSTFPLFLSSTADNQQIPSGYNLCGMAAPRDAGTTDAATPTTPTPASTTIPTPIALSPASGVKRPLRSRFTRLQIGSPLPFLLSHTPFLRRRCSQRQQQGTSPPAPPPLGNEDIIKLAPLHSQISLPAAEVSPADLAGMARPPSSNKGPESSSSRSIIGIVSR